MDIKMRNLGPLLSTLQKYGVTEFDTGAIKIKLQLLQKAEVKTKNQTDLSDPVNKKTPEQEAKEVLYWSTNS